MASVDATVEDAELMSQGQDFDGKLAARSDEGKGGKEHGPDEVEHDSGAWLGPGVTSMISRWTGFL